MYLVGMEVLFRVAGWLVLSFFRAKVWFFFVGCSLVMKVFLGSFFLRF